VLLSYAKHRVRAFLDEVQRVHEVEFPYHHSRLAVERIRRLFEAKLNRLEKFDEKSDPGVVKRECALALTALFEYVPLLGFTLRSTNVRNAFEVFGPLLRLARELLEHGVDAKSRTTHLVFSSEWDYSPFVFGDIPDLPGFVLIGLPAPESANPLLIPLAGHELGHSLWATRRLAHDFRRAATREVVDVIKARFAEFRQVFPLGRNVTADDLDRDMFCLQFWQQIVPWTLRQAEESFCDFVGVRLFGESYLNAFAYLLCPGMEWPRTLDYPNLRERVDNLLFAADQMHVDKPSGYADLFENQAEPVLSDTDKFRLSVADQALRAMRRPLVERADREVTTAGISPVSEEEVLRIYERFQRVVPAEGCAGLPDILNAAWRAYRQSDLWSALPQIANNRERNLKELVLKNVEVFEIEQILKESA
jgi:hypothetical protein